MQATLPQPRLWWPNGQGEPYLYTSRVDLYGIDGVLLDTRKAKVGFRTVELVIHDGGWAGMALPSTRNNPPITLEVNGRKIFAKGSNWLCPDIFPGRVTGETYRELVTLAAEAHFNLLRTWGGAAIGKRAFFDTCDELGILVWQEFPLACNNYVGTPPYLQVLDAESRSIVKRLRRHPSVAFWCGGNELFNNWSCMTEQSLALRLLNRNCYELDPGRPFIMTSPLEGMSHGHYLFKDGGGEEVFQIMPRMNSTAYTEFGCSGPSPAAYIRSFIPEGELFPPQNGGAWKAHHGYGAWDGHITSWLAPEIIESYFGPSHTLEELCERGQLLQNEGYKCIYEEARRQKPRCSMALNWCYNEPWPTAAGNSLLNWPIKPKPSYYAVKASCRPVLASLQIPKFQWKAGEVFNPVLWLLNDSQEEIESGTITVYLNGTEIFTWKNPPGAGNGNLKGPMLNYILPPQNAERMTLAVKAAGRGEWDSEYVLLAVR
jgi:beta-mannosidase